MHNHCRRGARAHTHTHTHRWHRLPSGTVANCPINTLSMQADVGHNCCYQSKSTRENVNSVRATHNGNAGNLSVAALGCSLQNHTSPTVSKSKNSRAVYGHTKMTDRLSSTREHAPPTAMCAHEQMTNDLRKRTHTHSGTVGVK
jgi:hypothetical protein